MRLFLLILVCGITFTASAQPAFETGEQGTLYKIIPGTGTGTAIKTGDIIQHYQYVKFGDSVVQDTKVSGNVFLKIDSADQPFTTTAILRKMKVGDSAFIKISCDSLFAFALEMGKQQGETREKLESRYPKFLTTKGNFVELFIKVLNQYANDSLAMIDYKLEEVKMNAYAEKMQEKNRIAMEAKDKLEFPKCDKALKKFLGTKISTYKKTKSGAYVQFLKKGTGPLWSKGKVAEVRYKGMLLNGQEFDSNQKKKGQEDKPLYALTPGEGGAIKGFEEAVSMMHKGDKVKVYIPCNLGYAGMGSGSEIPPYSNLIFEIELVNVKSK
jgi:FKBP-type peptidyl-prolyl cis-trans isomerase